MFSREFSEVLEVILTEQEIREKSEENTKRVLELAGLKADKKRADEMYTSRMKLVTQEAENTARVLEAGKERRAVDCEWFPNTETVEMVAFRLDTNQILRRRPMDGDERREYLQGKLWGTDSDAARPETNNDAVKEFFDDIKSDVITPDEITIHPLASQFFTDADAELASPDVLQATLALVIEKEIAVADIETWSDEQRRQAQDWAVAAHAHANDHDDVDVPPKPEFLSQYEKAEDDLGGTPFPTEYAQWEMESFASYYCADKIGTQEPVKICYINGEPHVITEYLGIGPREVTAYPILPLENVTEEGAAALRAEGHFYIGKKINCGSKKNSESWVIVGPEKTFTLARSHDEMETPQPVSQSDGFTATRCDECKRIDGGHADTCSQSETLTFDKYLAYAKANYKKNHNSYARKMDVNRNPEVDAKVKNWLKERATTARTAEGGM